LRDYEQGEGGVGACAKVQLSIGSNYLASALFNRLPGSRVLKETDIERLVEDMPAMAARMSTAR
jgi:hypothetical protein